MVLKDAFVRAVRTGLQAFVGASAVGVIGTLKDWADVKKLGISLALAAVIGLAAFVVSVAQNLIEDNSEFQAPK